MCKDPKGRAQFFRVSHVFAADIQKGIKTIFPSAEVILNNDTLKINFLLSVKGDLVYKQRKYLTSKFPDSQSYIFSLALAIFTYCVNILTILHVTLREEIEEKLKNSNFK